VKRLTAQVLDLTLAALERFIEATFVDNYGPKEWQQMVDVPPRDVPPRWQPQDIFKLLKQHWFSLGLGREVQEIVTLVEHVHERHTSSSSSSSSDNGAGVPKQTFLMLFDKAERLLAQLTAASPSPSPSPLPSLEALRDELARGGAQMRELRTLIYQRVV